MTSPVVSPPSLAPAAPWRRTDTLSTAIIGLLAALTRFLGLGAIDSEGTPVFDEKHYVPQAWDMVESATNPLLGGIESNPAYGLVVHPPLGKQLIALGEMLVGYSPLGWRLSAALMGTITVVTIMALARQLSGSSRVATFAGILALFDGVLLVTSRFGMLDIFLTCFVVLAAWALARDHNQLAARLAAAGDAVQASVWGPRLGFRWWRFSAGVFLGLALSVKWSGLYYIAFFGVAILISDALLRRRFGVHRPWLGALRYDCIPAVFSLLIFPSLLYLWSWRAWFSSETSVYRHAATDGTISPDSWLSTYPDAIASWLYYQIQVLEFHASLTTSNGHTHPWDSKPFSWLAALRPILYYSVTDQPCAAGTCRQIIYLFGTPIIWWLTIPILVWALWQAIRHRERAVVLPLIAFAAGYLPWVINYDRQMYFFYATPLIPFTICLLAIALGKLWGAGRPILLPGWRSTVALGTATAMSYLFAVLVCFLFFSPLFYGFLIPDGYYESMMWLNSWR